MSAASVWPAFRARVVEVAGPADPPAVLAGIVDAVARSLGVERPDVESILGVPAHAGVGALDVPPELARPDLVGWVLESLLDPDVRHRSGAYYTPVEVTEGLVAVVLDGWAAPRTGAGSRPGAGSRRDQRAGSAVPRTARTPSTSRSGSEGGDERRAGPSICDPSVGGGAFLLAAARALRSRGVAPADVLTDHLWGVDIDPLAVATTRAVLALWAATEGCPVSVGQDRLVVADFLDDPLPAWSRPPLGFDVVVGNPPFQGQLGASTARSVEAAAGMRAWLGDAVHGYVDTAALFLLAASRRTAPGGWVALILPESVLAAAHAAGVRRSLLDAAELRGLWIPGGPMFAAGVRVCAPVLEVGGAPTGAIRRWSGPEVAADGELTAPAAPRRQLTDSANSVPEVAATRPPGGDGAPREATRATGAREVTMTGGVDRTAPQDGDRRPAGGAEPEAADRGAAHPGAVVDPVDRSVPLRDGTASGRSPADDWARLLAAASGLPPLDLGCGEPRLSSIASATAGFRQHFYGLADHVREHDDGLMPLITVGAIDPARCRWGARETRFVGRRWRRPAVDLDALAADDAEIARWVTARLVPKVLVATQTRVIEAVADPDGAWVPSVPVIAVAPADADQVWHVAAVLLAPPISVWAAGRAWGSGLGKGTIRVSARQLAEAPLPLDRGAWDEGAALVKTAHDTGAPSDLLVLGETMTAAYGLPPDHPAFAWWRTRLRP